jgi:hypothetical protein
MRRAPLVLLAGLYLATPVFAAPPTEEEIAAKIATATEFYRSKGDAFSLEDPEFHAVLNAQLEGVDPADCDLAQVKAMGMLWQYTPTAKPIWLERVKALGSGDDWLDAALMLAGMDEMDAALEIGMMKGGFTSVPDERLGEVIGVMSMLDAMTSRRCGPNWSCWPIGCPRIPRPCPDGSSIPPCSRPPASMPERARKFTRNWSRR